MPWIGTACWTEDRLEGSAFVRSGPVRVDDRTIRGSAAARVGVHLATRHDALAGGGRATFDLDACESIVKLWPAEGVPSLYRGPDQPDHWPAPTLGTARNPRLEGDQVKADLEVEPGALGGHVLELCRRSPPILALVYHGNSVLAGCQPIQELPRWIFRLDLLDDGFEVGDEWPNHYLRLGERLLASQRPEDLERFIERAADAWLRGERSGLAEILTGLHDLAGEEDRLYPANIDQRLREWLRRRSARLRWLNLERQRE